MRSTLKSYDQIDLCSWLMQSVWVRMYINYALQQFGCERKRAIYWLFCTVASTLSYFRKWISSSIRHQHALQRDCIIASIACDFFCRLSRRRVINNRWSGPLATPLTALTPPTSVADSRLMLQLATPPAAATSAASASAVAVAVAVAFALVLPIYASPPSSSSSRLRVGIAIAIWQL